MPKRVPTIPITLTEVRETDEYDAEAAKIRDQFLAEKEEPRIARKQALGNRGPVKSLREHILAMSLFPNIYRGPQHHRTFSNVRTDDNDAENYYAIRKGHDLLPHLRADAGRHAELLAHHK